MRLARLRWRFRSLMILVAVAALVFWGTITLRKRAAIYRERANYHNVQGTLEDMALGMIYHNQNPADSQEPGFQRRQRLIRFHRAMERKYQIAASQPWLSIKADPPSPP